MKRKLYKSREFDKIEEIDTNRKLEILHVIRKLDINRDISYIT